MFKILLLAVLSGIWKETASLGDPVHNGKKNLIGVIMVEKAKENRVLTTKHTLEVSFRFQF